MEKCLNVLGRRVEDKVTTMAGVATSVSFDLYGCIQVLVHPGLDKKGNIKDRQWFDISRLRITGDPVMEPPDFGWVSNVNQTKQAAGPEHKPMMRSKPTQ